MNYRPSWTSFAGEKYRWVIIVGGIIGLFAALGLGRFSLGMMLPGMGEGLALSYSQMGMISTVNFCGYLGAVLLCGILVSRLGARLLIFLALLLIAGSMALVGFSSRYLVILSLYFLTGVGSALVNIPIMALVASWFDGPSRGRAAGLCVMGNGIGILVSGRLIPILDSSMGGWRTSWHVLAAIVAVAALLCYLLLRNKPRKDQPTSVLQPAENAETKAVPDVQYCRAQVFYHCGAIYFLFGFTYVIYVTFFVTSLVQDHGFMDAAAGALWSWSGLLSLASGPLFGYFSDRWGRKKTLIAVFVIQSCAYLLMAIQLPTPAVYISAFCYGIVAWSVPSIMAAMVGDLAGPERTAAVFGFVTFLFGIGQIAGPAFAGFLAEQSGAFNSAFLLAAVFTAVAVVLSVLLPSTKVT